MTALAEKKLEFIREVSDISDGKTLAALIEAYRKITGEAKAPSKTVNPIRQKFDADAIRQRRGHHRKHSTEFKSKAAIEALKEQKNTLKHFIKQNLLNEILG